MEDSSEFWQNSQATPLQIQELPAELAGDQKPSLLHFADWGPDAGQFWMDFFKILTQTFHMSYRRLVQGTFVSALRKNGAKDGQALLKRLTAPLRRKRVRISQEASLELKMLLSSYMLRPFQYRRLKAAASLSHLFPRPQMIPQPQPIKLTKTQLAHLQRSQNARRAIRKDLMEQIRSDLRQQAFSQRRFLAPQPTQQQMIQQIAGDFLTVLPYSGLTFPPGLSAEQQTTVLRAIGSWNHLQKLQHQNVASGLPELKNSPRIVQNMNKLLYIYDQYQLQLHPRDPFKMQYKILPPTSFASPFAGGGVLYASYQEPFDKKLSLLSDRNMLVGQALVQLLPVLWAAFTYLILGFKMGYIVSAAQQENNKLKEMTRPIQGQLNTIPFITFFSMPFIANGSAVYSGQTKVNIPLWDIIQRFRPSQKLHNNKIITKYWSQMLVPQVLRQISRFLAGWAHDKPNYVINEQLDVYSIRINNFYVKTWGIYSRILYPQPKNLLLKALVLPTLDPSIIQYPHVVEKLNWKFYGTKKMRQALTNTLPPRQCIDVAQKQLLKRNLPPLGLTDQYSAIKVRQYCQKNSVNLRIRGFPDQGLFYCFQSPVIIIAPGHIQVTNHQVHKQKPLSAHIATYRPRDYYQKNQKLVMSPQQDQITYQTQNWKVGMPIPVDQQIDLPTQLKLRNRILVIDIQALATRQQRQIPYMICAVGYLQENDNVFYRCWQNTGVHGFYNGQQLNSPNGKALQQSTCINDFVEWLSAISDQYTAQSPLMIWGYNMMGYQITYLLPVLTKRFGIVQTQGPPNDCKAFSVNQNSIRFADIMKVNNPASLKVNCKQYRVVIQKAQLQIGLVSQWQQVQKRFQQIRNYCYIDCVSSLLLLHKIQCAYMFIASQLGLCLPWNTISQRVTASGVGFWFYLHGFFKRSMTNDINAKLGRNRQGSIAFINSQPWQVYQQQRQSFFGGVVQVFRYQCRGRIYIVDVNSMYPHVIRKPLPWTYINTQHINNQKRVCQILQQRQSDLYLFNITQYQLPPSFKGAFITTKQCRQQRNTYFNTYDQKTSLGKCLLHGAALKRIIKVGGRFSTNRVHRYTHNDNSLADFANYFYKMRKQAKNPAVKTGLKLIMNSLIGRFSMSQKNSHSVTVLPKTDQYKVLQKGLYIDQGPMQLPPIGRLVRLTSMVTQYARIYLDQLAQKAGYQNLCYCDTDSLIVTQQGYRRLGSPSTKASQLGQFKCQGPSPQVNYYDRALFFGRKNYLLFYGQHKFTYKAKGVPKRYIDQDLVNRVVQAYRRICDSLIGQPFGAIIPLDVQVDMQVWRRKFINQGGITIKSMLKNINVTVDRQMTKLDQVGLPRSPALFKQI